MLFSSAGESNSAPPNPLARFEGPLQSGGKRGKGRKGGDREKDDIKGRDGREHVRINFLFTALTVTRMPS